VSGIPYNCQEEDLRNFFASESITEIKLPKYQDTGRCRGYAHLVFDSQEEYEKALQKNHESIGERYLDIKPAKGEKVIDSSTVSIPVGCKVLFVKNLPYEIEEEEIKTEFSSCGIVTDVRMVFNSSTKLFKGFAYIDFRDLGSVKKAIHKYHGKKFRGRALQLDAVTTGQKKGFKRRYQNE
jgi:nucleolin